MKEETKLKLNKFGALATRFIESDWWIALNLIIVFIGWVSSGWYVVLPILVVANVLPLFFFRGTKHLLPILYSFVFMINSDRHDLGDYSWLLAFIIILLAGVVFSLVRFKRDYSPLAPKRIKGFHAALIALVVPFAFAGVTRPAESPVARVAALAFIIVVALGYTFFVLTTREDKDELALYVIKILFCSGLVVCAQAVVYYATVCETFDELRENVILKLIDLGWSSANNIAPAIAMAIPATLYLCIKRNKIVPLLVLIALFEYLVIICTGSRGTILFTTIALPIMLLYVMAKTENKLAFGASVCVLFALAVGLVVYFGDQVGEILTKMLDKGFDSSGRTETLYPIAIDTFKNDPIFGAGWDFRIGEIDGNNYSPYWHHSTALQILADMGIVGAIAFAFFYFHRYRTFFVLRKKPEAVMLLLSLLIFDAYGMIDTAFFSPPFFIMLLVISLAVEVALPDDKCRAFGGRDPIADVKALIANLKANRKSAPQQAEPEDTASNENENTEE
ncbi:MAG: O-antigen ligase family protein [Clostridia bacterium]|nr:O-antigen ligase family protein [Clostridia bacterium]